MNMAMAALSSLPRMVVPSEVIFVAVTAGRMFSQGVTVSI